MVFYVNSQKSNSPQEIASFLNRCILHYPGKWSELVFLCIGSDRVTGDCLGPYIGHQLTERLAGLLLEDFADLASRVTQF